MPGSRVAARHPLPIEFDLPAGRAERTLTMLFYERAVALNRDRHQKLRMEALANHYAFAAKTNAMLIASTELAEAARDHPIVFVGPQGGPFALAALVGLRNDENLLVDAAGQWDPQ